MKINLDLNNVTAFGKTREKRIRLAEEVIKQAQAKSGKKQLNKLIQRLLINYINKNY